MKKQKSKDDIRDKKLIVSVIGTTTSGKTFLIFNLTKLFTFFGLTKNRLPYILKPLTKSAQYAGSAKKPRLRSLNELTGDLKSNITAPAGTKHSLDPDLYEYQYDNILERVSKGIKGLFSRNPSNVYFKIRNIPGEMLDTYFLQRSRGQAYTSLNDLFDGFIDQDINGEELLKTFKNSVVENENDFKTLNDRFYEYCKTVLNSNPSAPAQDLSDGLQIKSNFYSYLFFRTSTDVIICHDVSTDVSQHAQRSILDALPTNNPTISDKNLYYAFTKYDTCVEDPLINYVDHQLSVKDPADYWEVAEKNLQSVYGRNSFIKSELLLEIDRLHQNDMVHVKYIGEDGFYVLRYAYFICTNYRNLNSQEFLTFDRGQPSHWTEDNYVPDSFPLGCIELLMSLLDNNDICRPVDLGLDFSAHKYNLLQEAYVK